MNTRFVVRQLFASLFLLILFSAGNLLADKPKPQYLDKGLFLKAHPARVGMTGPVMTRIVEGKNIDARNGESVTLPHGTHEVWKEEVADSDNWFRGENLRGAYGYFVVNSSSERTAILESFGDDMVYVNGVPREGNKYAYKDTYPVWEASYNYSEIPISLRKGKNEFVFLCNRGRLKARLLYIEPQVLFNTGDVTVPNFLVGQKVDDYAAVVVINATHKPLIDAVIKASSSAGIGGQTKVPIIQPMSLRKIGFKLVGPPPTAADTMGIQLSLYAGGRNAKKLASGEIDIETVIPSATHKVTFISDIDSSIQYYAVVPPRGPNNGKPKALFLSLHGADVIATNQANSYYPKTWGYIVCPTNGRPYGWDWESWGRLDMLQVLHIAKSTMNIDPSRIYLTGHSMGGHGTIINGATYPDQFGAIGASAGWISWWTYVFHHDTSKTPMAMMLRRATMPLRTLQMKDNYKQLGVYILQGSKDDNVPITEGIHLSDTLKTFDKDFIFHEEMGVGHWWSLGDEAGADCVDWPPMFDYFGRHARPGISRIRDIDFTTASPGVSAKDYWLTIYSQIKQLEPSNAKIRFNPSRNKFLGTTSNVKEISFDLKIADIAKPIVVDLDSTTLDSVVVPPGTDRLWLENESGRWHVVGVPSSREKSPERYGTFKDAFRHGVVFVYGTHGTKAENEWAFDKARADAEYFWYQGNGSIEILSDRDFNPSDYPNRDVVLYGNETTNSAWNQVLADSPVSVSDGKVVFGSKVIRGNDYALLMIRPRKGSETASVGVVGGTGLIGMRLTYTVPYLEPGFALPDVTLLNREILSKGLAGLKASGFFGLDWSVRNGDFVWQ